MYSADFGHDGLTVPIITAYHDGEAYPIAGRDALLKLIPSLRSRYPTYASFGASRIEDLFPRSELEAARVSEAQTFASAVALNLGGGRYRLSPLPDQAQLAPVYAILPGDFDGDGRVDLLLAGNLYGVQPSIGRLDASRGVLLRGDGRGGFTAVDPEASGVVVEGQSRKLAWLRRPDGGRLVVVARNNDRLALLRPTRGAAAQARPGGSSAPSGSR
jgi:hypothetical protein